MYKIFFGILIAFIAFITVTTCVFRPEMHKTVFVYDSAYEIVEPKVEVETVKTMPTQPVEPPKVQKVQKETQTVAVQTKTTPKTTTVTTPKKTTVSTQKTAQKTTTPVKTTQTTTQKKTTSTPVTTAKTTQTTPKQTQTTKTTTTPQKTTKTQTVQKPMTEAERIRQEEILWNKWRSDLQNQIMRDTKLPIVPQGTVFKFSFDVDKFGKVTNVHTWSTTPTYTPYAIQYIAPVIRSYQGRSILNFPAGSNRVATTVEGGWKIAQTAKYSTSADYNDTERVSR